VAVYMEIRKALETETEVIYDFLPDADETRTGKLIIEKQSGEIKELEPILNDNQKFYFSRAVRKVLLHHEKGQYPDQTCWAS
jgi:hypothetical protein